MGLSSVVLVPWLVACSEPPPTTVPNDQATTIALSAEPFSSLEIAPNSRPQGEPQATIKVVSSWHDEVRRRSKSGPAGKFPSTRLPIRPRGLYFSRPPPGMTLSGPNGVIAHRSAKADDGSPFWSNDANQLTLYRWSADPPQPGDIVVNYGTAAERERRLNYEWSGAPDAESFVRATVQVAEESLTGLLLPPPAKASWDVTVPAAASLTFRAGIAPSEALDGPPSDGATLLVHLNVDGTEHTLAELSLSELEFSDHQLDLEAYAGKQASLTFETRAGGDRRFDYVMVAEPVLGSRKENPRTVLLVFIDTLRPDHTSVYGYRRDTTPNTVVQANQGTVFTEARTVAPWTLPSTRAVVTGRHPEMFDKSDTLQQILRKQGFNTYMRAGNLYLGSKFGLQRDWGRHVVTLWPSAKRVVDDTLEYLDAHEGHDTFAMVHFMDVHLPFQEGRAAPSLRYKWAGKSKRTLHLKKEEFGLNEVRQVQSKLTEREKQYIRNRYDQNILFVDRELQRLYERLDANDILVVFSDHGEEFFEHGGYEHGHTLYDEVLRVPLIIRAPGVPAGTVDAPTSLVDIAPTVLELLGLDPGERTGTSLLPVVRGDAGAAEALRGRDQVFGRMLYGRTRWGVLQDHKKYATHESDETLFDLAADPGELDNLLKEPTGTAGVPYWNAIEQVIDRDMGPQYRLEPTSGSQKPEEDLVVRFTVPGGIERVWQAEDPTGKSHATIDIDGEVATVTWHKGHRGGVEVFVKPLAPFGEVTHGLALEATYGDETVVSDPIDPQRSARFGADRSPLMSARPLGRGVTLSWGFSPAPLKGATKLEATDPEMMEALRAMGYVHD